MSSSTQGKGKETGGCDLKGKLVPSREIRENLGRSADGGVVREKRACPFD